MFKSPSKKAKSAKSLGKAESSAEEDEPKRTTSSIAEEKEPGARRVSFYDGTEKEPSVAPAAAEKPSEKAAAPAYPQKAGKENAAPDVMVIDHGAPPTKPAVDAEADKPPALVV